MPPEKLLGQALCMNSAVLYYLGTSDSEREKRKDDSILQIGWAVL